MYSEFMREHFPATTGKKLTPNLNNETEYTVHYRNLQWYTQVHRVLEFKQSPWLKCYVDLNTLLRSVTLSDFEKHFF